MIEVYTTIDLEFAMCQLLSRFKMADTTCCLQFNPFPDNYGRTMVETTYESERSLFIDVFLCTFHWKTRTLSPFAMKLFLLHTSVRRFYRLLIWICQKHFGNKIADPQNLLLSCFGYYFIFLYCRETVAHILMKKCSFVSCMRQIFIS